MTDFSPKIPVNEIHAWLFEAALPFWAAHGVDQQDGGFLEELAPDGAVTDIAFKRVRVQCRQVYVFSHAALIGWPEGAALSDRGFSYLLDKCWQGAAGGWAHKLSRQGDIIDSTPGLYEQAFGLFAAAWRYRLTGEASARKIAHETLDFVEHAFRDPKNGGYWDALPPSGARGQNPHMHLTEACIAAYEAGLGDRFLERATELTNLFRDRFFDGRVLHEFFRDDWRPALGEAGRRTEPGHHFEWTWILAQHQRLTGQDWREAMRALTHFAEAWGVCAQSGAVRNVVRDDGVVIDPSSRTWPNTERIKARLALFELCGDDPSAPVTQATRLLLDRYFAKDQQGRHTGAWHDALSADGELAPGPTPASTFYHIFLALSEILRLQDQLP